MVKRSFMKHYQDWEKSFLQKREAGIEIGLSISKIYFKTIEAIIQ